MVLGVSAFRLGLESFQHLEVQHLTLQQHILRRLVKKSCGERSFGHSITGHSMGMGFGQFSSVHAKIPNSLYRSDV